MTKPVHVDTSPIPDFLAKKGYKAGGSSVTCPVCASTKGAVTDSRPSEGSIRRRRMCSNGHRFSTIEVLTTNRPDLDPKVLKNLIDRCDAGSHQLDAIRSILSQLVSNGD